MTLFLMPVSENGATKSFGRLTQLLSFKYQYLKSHKTLSPFKRAVVVTVFPNSKMQHLIVLILSRKMNTCFSRAVRLMVSI